jgi:uncharacterized protein YjiS (DUF1127 family)
MSLVLSTKSDDAGSLHHSGIASLIANAAQRFARWRAAGHAARQLSRYPDALLKDMGIARSEIRDAVRNGRDRAHMFDVDMGNNVR